MEISYPLSRDTLTDINERIQELTAKIKDSTITQEKLYGQIQLTPEVIAWNKELRKLRRIRDANDKI